MDGTFELAKTLLEQQGLPADDLEPLHGWSNAVWLGPTHVVRLSSGRFRQSFRHEANVIAACFHIEGMQEAGEKIPGPTAEIEYVEVTAA